MNLSTLSPAKVLSRATTLEEVVDMDQETERQQVRDTRVRRLVQVLHVQVSKVVRCHFTDVFLREVSQTSILRKSLQSTWIS